MKLLQTLFLGLVLSTAGCSFKKENRNKKDKRSQSEIEKEKLNNKEDSTPKKTDEKKPVKEAAISDEVSAKIAAVYLDRYPELTVSLAVKNIYKTITLVEEAGGEVVYDPNLGNGSSIPFIVVTLPPLKLMDKKFIKSLDLNAISIDLPLHNTIKPMAASSDGELPTLNNSQLYIPVNDVKIDKLREREAGKGLGEGVRIAVIDTGVDASHSAFGDRVVFWSDETQEGRVPMKSYSIKTVETDDTVVKSVISYQGKDIEIPAGIDTEKPVYLGVVDEEAMGAQVSNASKNQDKQGLDINHNKSVKDKNIVLAGYAQGTEDLVAYFDFDGDSSFSTNETKLPILDFNQYRSRQRAGDDIKNFNKFLQFPSSSKTIAYPVIFEKKDDGTLSYLTLGMDLGSHGTHVAGIAAGSGARIQGAAPKAEIMALKVCSGITCTDSAIVRGLIKAFYNDQNLVPDIVNISLGSQQGYSEGFYDLLIRDLSAKFGATFFISASNSGPGHRSLNSLGSLSPAVLVGAHVSRNTLIKHYGFNPNVPLQEHQQLFFSSVGPSYTGEQRPNITAPGSALSSTPLIDHGAAMYNGTSMSSPLSAGSAAALLSLLKTNENYKWFSELKNKKIASLQDSSLETSNYSLIQFPLLFRASLEDSASKKDFDGYSQAQIGYGLLDINAAYDVISESIKKLKAPEGGESPYSHYYFNAKINDNKKAGRLYNRGEVNVATSKPIKISVNVDGEMSEAALESIQTAEITVKLAQVEVQDSLGHVKKMDMTRGPLPFSIADTKSDGLALTGSIVLNNGRRAAFSSLRNRKLMNPGEVYIARYELYLQEHRVLTVLDVVHMPLELTQSMEEVYLPAINSRVAKKSYVQTIRSQEIKASETHRYPVALRTSDSEVAVSLGIDHEAEGRLILRAYDPDGNEVKTAVVYKSSEVPDDSPVAQIKIPTIKKQGIYEFTVTAYSGSFLVDSKYDLAIEAIKFKPSVKALELQVGSKQVFAVTNPTAKYSSADAVVAKVEKVVSLKNAELTPNYRTFKRIDFPKGSDAKLASMTIRLDHRNNEIHMENWLGRIDHRLYTLKDGKSTVLVKAVPGPSGTQQTFKNVPTTGPVFIALESFSVVPEDESIKKAFRSLDFEAVLGTATESVTVDKLSQSADDVYLFEVTAPRKLASSGYELRTFVEVKSEGVSVKVPVAVVPAAK